MKEQKEGREGTLKTLGRKWGLTGRKGEKKSLKEGQKKGKKRTVTKRKRGC